MQPCHQVLSRRLLRLHLSPSYKLGAIISLRVPFIKWSKGVSERSMSTGLWYSRAFSPSPCMVEYTFSHGILQFPTRVEQLLWRISALTVGIAPTVSALLVLMEDLISHRTDRWSKWSVAVLAPAYVAARLYIIVESFRSLYYMPVKAFIATRTVNIPHIG